MGRYISSKDEQDICEHLEKWERGDYGKKLTWAKLAKRFEYSRQAMSGNESIRSKYIDAKAALKGNTAQVESLLKEIQELKNEVESLNIIKHEYEQKYIRWQLNAMAKGVSVQALNQEVLPTIKEELRKRSELDI